MKLLDSAKISLLFQLQLHQVYRLFQLKEGRFRFDDFAELQNRILTIPWLEMTGHRIKTSEVSMYALRLMENSDNFVGQLPAPSQALSKIVTKPYLKLTTVERELWELADSKTSLLAIAKMTRHPLTIIQATAFRLMTIGLVDAVFIHGQDWEQQDRQQATTEAAENVQSPATVQRETSLLKTLSGLFKRKP